MASRSDLDLALRIRADAKQARAELGAVNRDLEVTKQSANALASAVRGVTLGLAAGFSIAEIARASDAWTDFNNRLRLVASSQSALSVASMSVYQIAQTTSQALMGTATVYQRFAQQSDVLGLNQKELARLTETVSKAIAVSGSTAASADAALMQFGQALASGVLRGEEFNSVAEQAPALLTALATGLSVTNAQLRAMAGEGKLTADVLVTALQAAQSSVDEQFATRVKTISAAVVELDNAFTRMIGTLSSTEGVGSGVASSISGLASVLDSLSNNASVLGTALDVALAMAAGRAVAALLGLSAESLKSAMATGVATKAILQKTLADEGTAVSAHAAAIAELERSRIAVAAAQADVAASRARQAANIQNLNDVRASLTAELALEQHRLKAQITEKGRQAAVARMAELRLAETATIRQLALAEQALASTTVASSAAITAAYERRAVAQAGVVSSQAALNAATAASTAAAGAAATANSLLARSYTAVMAGGSRILGFLGGPVGLIATLALTALAFIDFGDDAQKGMNKAAESTESAAARIRNASRQQLTDLGLGDTSKASYDQLGKGIETLKAQLKEAEAIRDKAQTIADSDVPVAPGVATSLPSLKEADERVQSLRTNINKLEAEQGGKRFKNIKEGKEYLEQLEKQNQKIKDLGSAEEARLFLQQEKIDAESELGKKILAQAEANDRLEASKKFSQENERAASKARKDAIRDAEQLRSKQESYVSGLKKEAETLGMTDAQLRAYTLSEQHLQGALQKTAQAQIDRINAYERQKQALENADTNAGLEADYLSAIGRETDAALLEISTKYNRLRRDFEKTGNETGKVWAEKLIDVERVKARLDAVQSEMDKSQSAISRAENRINIEREAGLITQTEAQQKLLALRADEIKLIEGQLPKLHDLAAQGGVAGEQAQIQLDDYQTRLIELKNTATDLQRALNDGLTEGLNEAIKGLADGTMTLRDAISSLVLSVADSLAQLAAQQLADQALSSIKSLFSSGDAAATAVDTTAQSVAITTASGLGAAAMGDAILLSGLAAAEAMAAAISGAGAGSTGGAAGGLSGLTGLFGGKPTGTSTGGTSGGGFWASLAGLFGGGGTGAGAGAGFAEGGHVSGPGTGTSDSISAWLSNDEFVTRSAVVRQPGALPFLNDFNRRGMATLDDYARRIRHATGGLAGIPAPAMPAPTLGSMQLAEPAKAQGATVKNAINLYAVQDESAIASMAWGRAGQENYKLYLQRNASEIRSILKI